MRVKRAKIVRLTESDLVRAVRSSVARVLREDRDYGFMPFFDASLNITDDVKEYLDWSFMGETDPNYSRMACKLHRWLMGRLGLSHENEQDRRTFANILSYIRVINARVGIKSIKAFMGGIGKYWEVETNVGSEYRSWEKIRIFPKDFRKKMIKDLTKYGVVYRAYGGVDLGEPTKTYEYSGRDNDYQDDDYQDDDDLYDDDFSGFRYTYARMKDDMKQKIYDMGLVPALLVTGSYHENFITCVGVLPDYASQLKKIYKDEEGMNGLYFSCEFVDWSVRG